MQFEDLILEKMSEEKIRKYRDLKKKLKIEDDIPDYQPIKYGKVLKWILAIMSLVLIVITIVMTIDLEKYFDFKIAFE